MVAVNIRHARWVGVEFQPDLKHPSTPVRLGLVLHKIEDGRSSFVVIGRMPRKELRPKEFKSTSPMTMEIAENWVQVMFKEAMDVAARDLLSKLADSWHWNLYVIKPKAIDVPEDNKFLAVAKRLYEEFVGEPFETERKRTKPRKPARPRTRPLVVLTPPAIPPAWQLKEIMERNLGERRV
jgi:hypothetical protein